MYSEIPNLYILYIIKNYHIYLDKRFMPNKEYLE